MPQSSAVQSILSQQAGWHARTAITELARAAACEEVLEDGSHNEGQLWFLVRALCAEHGVGYTTELLRARSYALTMAMEEK